MQLSLHTRKKQNAEKHNQSVVATLYNYNRLRPASEITIIIVEPLGLGSYVACIQHVLHN